jgi:hypothetical protein
MPDLPGANKDCIFNSCFLGDPANSCRLPDEKIFSWEKIGSDPGTAPGYR